MRASLVLACAVVALGFPLRASAQQQRVLVLCTGDTCTYQQVGAFVIGGKAAVRALQATTETITQNTLKGSRELKLEQVSGLVRDAASGAFYLLGPDGQRREQVVPPSLPRGLLGTHAAVWAATPLELRASSKVKSGTPVSADSFAYLLTSPVADTAALQLMERLATSPDGDPRRQAIIRAGAQFTAKSPGLQQWRESLVARMRGDLARFEQQDGNPAVLVGALRDAMELRAIYLQVRDGDRDSELLSRIAATDDLFRRQGAIADALRGAGYWDEFLAKIRQMRLAKWILPDLLSRSTEAHAQALKAHRQRSRSYADEGQLDRAFDEAERAAANSCQSSVDDDFYRVRVELVNHAQIDAASEYTGRSKALLEQIVRELDELDVNKEQLTLERIRQGEALDPEFLPLQLKKAEFLDKLGRYSAGLDVVRHVERNVRLDRRQLEEVLRLDGRITNNLRDALQKSQEESGKNFEAQRFQAALEVAMRGLRADPANPVLLHRSALASAFLRQRTQAVELIRTYLSDANLSCMPAEETQRMLDLYGLLNAQAPVVESANAIPNWISGARYRVEDVSYDPISMGFLQPVSRITADDGVTTLFVREDRSFLVRSITTEFARQPNLSGPAQVLFEAEPKYDRQTLSMLEIGPRATSAGERTAYALTYLTTPGVDPDLVFRFTGNQIARGWAGNPFFHPFVWNGFYVFDLTYDQQGRLATATPVRENAGARTDPFSEPIQFTWLGNTKRLLSVRGTRSGYLRELTYASDGRLVQEKITHPKGNGTIEYQYSNGGQLSGARSTDRFFDGRERNVQFDAALRSR